MAQRITGALRLDRILASQGLCTRSQAKHFLLKHKVRVDGRPPQSIAMPITTESKITVDGEELLLKPLHVLVHKPVGYVCSRRREASQIPVVYDLLPERWVRLRPKIAEAGRLDRWASGLLLMTQDGKLRHRVSSPRYKGGALGKVYEIKLERPLTGNEASIVEAGELKLRGEEKPLRPAVFEVVNAEEHLVRMTLYEGRYHQIRRMLAAMGNRAAEIKRISLGRLQLGDLGIGHYRPLTEAELELLNHNDEESAKIQKLAAKRKSMLRRERRDVRRSEGEKEKKEPRIVAKAGEGDFRAL